MDVQPSMRGPLLLTFASFVLALAVLILMIFAPQEGAATNALSTAWGFVTGLVSSAWNWFFGTTKGSEAKTNIIAASAPPVVTQPALPPEPEREPVGDDSQFGGTPFQ